MEEILERARKVSDEAEVFMATSEETPIQFEANRLKHAQIRQSTTVALRLVRQGRIGYATGTSLDDAEKLVSMAADTAQFGTMARFELPSLSKYHRVRILDNATSAVPLETMVGLGEEMISAIRQEVPDIQCDAWVSKGTSKVQILNSRGGRASYRQTHFSLGVYVTLIRGTDMLFVGEGESSCHPVLDASRIIRMVKEQLERARDLASIASGQFPVIFTPAGVTSALVSPLVAAFNGKTVLEGASPVGNKLGETVFDTGFTLWDDPTVPFRPTSHPCDDEGVPAHRKPLIEKGVVANFLYDLQTAAQAGKQSTGNGGRGRGLPSPTPSAFVVAPGSVSFDDMVKDIKEGLIVEELMGAEQGNILGGDFSGNVLLGYKIENGRIKGRVKNTMVSGNIYQLLNNVTVGSDARWESGFMNTPSLCFPRVSVASK